jgi:hypothetical protein
MKWLLCIVCMCVVCYASIESECESDPYMRACEHIQNGDEYLVALKEIYTTLRNLTDSKVLPPRLRECRGAAKPELTIRDNENQSDEGMYLLSLSTHWKLIGCTDINGDILSGISTPFGFTNLLRDGTSRESIITTEEFYARMDWDLEDVTSVLEVVHYTIDSDGRKEYAKGKLSNLYLSYTNADFKIYLIRRVCNIILPYPRTHTITVRRVIGPSMYIATDNNFTDTRCIFSVK